MSDADDGPGLREVAYRLFATEYDDASLEYSQSDEERAPNYVVTPTGARVNRLFVVGVLTSVESVNEETLRARIVDPAGAFVVYAGQYQPDALAFFERAESPAFVAVTGKANTFQPDGSDRVLTSIRPENVNEVDVETRDRWVVTAAEQTLSRIGVAARALDREERGDELATILRNSGVDDALADGIPRAIDHYGTTADYLGELRQVALDALSVVAERREEVRPLSLDPGERTGEHTAAVLAERAPAAPSIDVDVDAMPADATGADSSGTERSGEASAASSSTTEEETDAATVEATAGAAGESGSTAEPTGTTAEEQSASTGSDEDPSTSGDEAVDATGEGTVTAESETAETDSGDTLGNFEPRGSEEGDAGTSASEDVSVDADTDPEELYELDEEEREEIESEYGVEFSSGTEVDDPGEADIDVPTADADAEAATDVSPEEPSAGTEPETDTETGSTPGTADAESTAETAGAEAESDDADADDDDTEIDGDADAGTDGTEADADVSDTDSASEADSDAEGEEANGDEAAAEADVDLDELLLDRMDELDDGDGVDREELIAAVVDETGASKEAVVEAIDDALMSGQCYEPDESTLKPI